MPENKSCNCRKLDSVTMPLDQTALIEAAAGTGKTYNIQNIVARLIAEEGFAIETLVIVTFTEKAAKELADRLRKMLELLTGVLNKRSGASSFEQIRAQELLDRFTALGIDENIQKERLEEALRNIDDCRVSTIHGFCFRLLSEYAFECSMTFQVQLEKNIKNFTGKLLKDYCRSKRYSSIDLPGWSELHPDDLSGDVHALLNRNNVKVVHTRKTFADESAIMQYLAELQEEFAALADKKRTINELSDKINTIDRIDGNSYIEQAVRALEGISAFSPGDWQSWYNVIKLFRSTKFIGRGKASRKKDEAGFKEYVDDYVTGKKLFTLAENYCLVIEKDCRIFLVEDAVKFVRENLEQWKYKDNFLDYNDLMLQADRALADRRFRKFIQEKFNAGIIDEFQDTDPLQYSIFKAIFLDRPGAKRLFMVGDPRQAIYSFRGGDMETYQTARRECLENNGNIYTLTTNYRSSGQMIDAFNRVFDHKDPFCTDEIAFETVEKPAVILPGIRFNGSEMAQPLSAQYYPECNREEIFELCAREVSCMAAYGEFEIFDDKTGGYRKITPGDIAVLATDNKFLDIIRQKLEEYGIPAIGERKGGVWSSAEAGDLFKFMQAVLENSNSNLVREALLTAIAGVELAELDVEAADAGEKMLAWRLNFIELSECWHQKGTAAFMILLIKMFALKEKLTVTAGGERALSNYIQLGDLLAAAELNNKLTPLGVLHFMQEKINSGSDEDSEMLESDRAAVHLLTIHKSKGLQFPIVFLPQLSARQPLSRSGLKFYHREHTLCCNIDEMDPEARTLAGLEEMQEIMRLVYVAITRACYFCRIIWGKGKVEKNTPMTWLFARQNEPANENLRKLFVTGKLSFAGQDIKIPEDMRQYDLFEKTIPGSYLPHFNDQIVEPEKIQAPRSCRYIISYSALNELGKKDDPNEDFSDRDGNDESSEDLFENALGEAENTLAGGDPEKLTGGIWAIPPGAAIGNAWHEILENTDFVQGIDDNLLKNIMANYGFKDPAHLEATAEMFRRLLEYQLPCGIKLKELTFERRLTELEFLLSSPAGFSFENITDAVNEYMCSEFGSNIRARGTLDMHRGFFTGFVDMIFEYNNKLYIVDWKSNALGFQKGSFFGDNLKQHMFKSLYPLQYLCYLAALLKYLEQRLNRRVDEQIYNEYVGGVYYIFLRGMMLEAPGGVFSAQVPYKTVRALADVITSGKEL